MGDSQEIDVLKESSSKDTFLNLQTGEFDDSAAQLYKLDIILNEWAILRERRQGIRLELTKWSKKVNKIENKNECYKLHSITIKIRPKMVQ